MIRYTKTKEELAEIGIDVVEPEPAKTEKRKVTREDLKHGRVSLEEVRKGSIEVVD